MPSRAAPALAQSSTSGEMFYPVFNLYKVPSFTRRVHSFSHCNYAHAWAQHFKVLEDEENYEEGPKQSFNIPGYCVTLITEYYAQGCMRESKSNKKKIK